MTAPPTISTRTADKFKLKLEELDGVRVLPACEVRHPFDMAVAGATCDRWEGHSGAHTWTTDDMSIQLRWWDGWEMP